MPRKLTREIFIRRSVEIHKNKYNYDKVVYVNNRTKVIITCPIHGDFLQTPDDHLSKKGCARCSPTFKMDKQLFIEKSRIVHGDKYLYDLVIYISAKSKVIITCRKHGNFKQQVTSHLMGNGCPTCGFEDSANAKRGSTNKFSERANIVHNNLYDYSKTDYIRRDKEVTIICRKHGEFNQLPSNHLQGKGCPRCNNSQGERIVSNYLTNLDIGYSQQVKWDDCRNVHKLPFDFYLPQYNALIEFDGLQHFEYRDLFGGEESLAKTQKNDKIKDVWCEQNNMYLLRISYKDIKYVESIIQKFLREINEVGVPVICATEFYNPKEYLTL